MNQQERISHLETTILACAPPLTLVKIQAECEGMPDDKYEEYLECLIEFKSLSASK